MARLVDVIEAMIKDMIDENDGQATINRSILAEQANCVPSQTLDAVGDDLTQSQAKTFLTNAVSVGAMSAKEGTAIMAAVSDRSLAKVDSDIRSVVRADIFKNALLGLMIK